MQDSEPRYQQRERYDEEEELIDEIIETDPDEAQHHPIVDNDEENFDKQMQDEAHNDNQPTDFYPNQLLNDDIEDDGNMISYEGYDS